MFQVTVHDPTSEHPHLTDEQFECADALTLGHRLHEVAGLPLLDGLVAGLEIVATGEAFEHELDGWVEVSARRVEQVGAVS